MPLAQDSSKDSSASGSQPTQAKPSPQSQASQNSAKAPTPSAVEVFRECDAMLASTIKTFGNSPIFREALIKLRLRIAKRIEECM